MSTAMNKEYHEFAMPSIAMYGPNREYPAIRMGSTQPHGECGGGELLQLSLDDVFVGRAWCNSPSHDGSGEPHTVYFSTSDMNFECEAVSAAISLFIYEEHPSGDEVWYVEDLISRVPVQRVAPEREMLTNSREDEDNVE